jgi:hypothetical protein
MPNFRSSLFFSPPLDYDDFFIWDDTVDPSDPPKFDDSVDPSDPILDDSLEYPYRDDNCKFLRELQKDVTFKSSCG